MSSEPEASYDCPSCGEAITVPIDPSAGTRQSYVEDCPVCCCPVVLDVAIDPEGDATVAARPE